MIYVYTQYIHTLNSHDSECTNNKFADRKPWQYTDKLTRPQLQSDTRQLHTRCVAHDRSRDRHAPFYVIMVINSKFKKECGPMMRN